MSRLIIPRDFLNQTILFGKIKDKHDADGVTSVLAPFLIQHEINLTADAAAKTDALTYDNDRQQFAGLKEMHRKERDVLFAPVIQRMRHYFQFLKTYYSPAIKQTGDWGATITNMGRIKYPAKFLQRVEMFNTLKKKYDTYPPGTSPLDAFLAEHNYSIADDHTAVQQAMTEHNNMLEFSGKTEYATEQRNLLWRPVLKRMRGMGNYLKKLFTANAKQIGLWGYAVDDSPRKPRMVATSLKLNSKKTFNGVVIGGTLKNTGTVPVHLYRGRKITGTPVIVMPQEMHEFTKGFSIVTVTNPSLTTSATFLCLRNR